MGVAPIPEEWRTAVCVILRTYDKKKIKMRLRAQLDFRTHFPDLWQSQLYDGIREYLERGICEGRHITTMDEPGETYDFIFTFHARKLYAKLNLTPEGELVIIYSAHPPLKGDTL